jgi:phospholipid/cholesterol/gamma-HCH transport system permease protein
LQQKGAGPVSDHATTAGSGIGVPSQKDDPNAPPEPAPGPGLIGGFFEWFGDLGIFSWRVMRAAATPPVEVRELIRQLDDIGSKSLPLVALAGSAIGVVLSMQASSSLTRFGAKSVLPSAVVYAVVEEMGPIITGLVVSGRVGAGIGAQLASMKVTEQIDAIEASAINPYRLLAATRIIACILMLPLLTLAADFCGLVMGWVTQNLAEPISLQHFITSGFKGAKLSDFLPPTFKTAVFGLIIGVVSCFQGMKTTGGADGVGKAATSSVVLSSLFVILADVVLVKFILVVFNR